MSRTITQLLGLFPAIPAPMAGVGDLPFRLLCRRFGARLTYSEMISTKALSYGDRKTKALLFHEGEAPFVVQIFGHEPDVMARGAAYAEEQGAAAVDLNMGCPAPKVANNGDGSALLRDPKLCAQLVREVRRAVSCPVTAKIRLGWDRINAVEVAKALEEAGVDAIAVHGRTRVQQYSGTADRYEIAKVKQAVSVPIIANGDVTDRASFEEMLRITGADGVMIGRGALGNPWIFREIAGGEPASVSERIQTALEHTRMITDYKGEKIGIPESRKHLCWYLKGLRGSAAVKIAINASKSYAETEELLLRFAEEISGRPDEK